MGRGGIIEVWNGCRNVPNGIEEDWPACGVVGLECLDVVLEAVWGDGAHVDDEGASQLGQVGGLLGVVCHDGACADCEADIGGEVLDDLQIG
jgi:hypothetical protein